MHRHAEGTPGMKKVETHSCNDALKINNCSVVCLGVCGCMARAWTSHFRENMAGLAMVVATAWAGMDRSMTIICKNEQLVS